MNRLKKAFLQLIYYIPACFRKLIYNIYDYVAYPDIREKKKSFGILNSDITFYVIRPYTNSNEGLMSLLLNVCRQIIYAEKKGYVPIVDFKNYKTQYSDERNTNIWEDYFEQLAPYSLDEVYSSKNVILCGLKPTREEVFEPYRRFEQEDVRLARALFLKYIKPQKKIIEFLDKELENIHPEKTIGLYLRGTDYLTIKPLGHYIQPTTEQAIMFIESQIDKKSALNIFLVTEDANIYNSIRRRFQDRLVIAQFDKFISDYSGEGYLFKSEKLNQISKSKYERGLFYLIKELLLSKCPYIIGGNTCGSWAAIAFSDIDTNFHIFDLGRYKN